MSPHQPTRNLQTSQSRSPRPRVPASLRLSSESPPSPPPRIVSACLAGFRCRYDARDKTDPRIVEMVRRGEAVPVCPEQLGGLPTPREAAAFVGPEHAQLQTRSGEDVTAQYERGSEEALRIARAVGAREAILKERSPACGSHAVYERQPDGSERLVAGEGITARRLRAEGLKVVSEEELDREE